MQQLMGNTLMLQQTTMMLALLVMRLMIGQGPNSGLLSPNQATAVTGSDAGGNSSGGSASGASSSGSTPTPASTTPSGPVPHGYDQIVKTFGQPGDRSQLVSEPMPAGPGGKMIPVTVHRKIAPQLKAAFEEVKAAGLSDEIKSFDGSFNPRKKRGGSTWSTHSWGIAVDLNAGRYPMGTSAQNTSPRFKQIAAIFARHGFYQIPTDPMHFQYCRGY